MALRIIRTIGDEILTKRAKEVLSLNDRTRELIGDMVDTMNESNGVGLAAPQVGVLKRIVVINVTEEKENTIVMINPQLVESGGEQTGNEGCLSVPGKVGVVTRPNHVIVRYRDSDFQEQTLEAEELLARAVCHELDHLEGKLYVNLVEGELMDVNTEDEE